MSKHITKLLSELKDEILWTTIIILIVILAGAYAQIQSCKEQLKTNLELTRIVIDHNTALQYKYNILK